MSGIELVLLRRLLLLRNRDAQKEGKVFKVNSSSRSHRIASLRMTVYSVSPPSFPYIRAASCCCSSSFPFTLSSLTVLRVFRAIIMDQQEATSSSDAKDGQVDDVQQELLDLGMGDSRLEPVELETGDWADERYFYCGRTSTINKLFAF